MPIVEAQVTISGVPLARVWDVVADMERYPATMADVLEVTFLERSDTRAVSSWRVLLNGSELTWTEEDEFVPMSAIHFCQIEGDLEVLRGVWTLEEVPGGVSVTIRTEFDLGIPSLAAVLDPIGIQAIKANSRQMLSSIGRTASAQPVEAAGVG